MRRGWLLVCVIVGAMIYILGLHSPPAGAQQTFLPEDAFKVGSTLTLNNDSDVKYTVLAQQGAWIHVTRQSDAQAPKDAWIYAPSGTIWTKVK